MKKITLWISTIIISSIIFYFIVKIDYSLFHIITNLLTIITGILIFVISVISHKDNSKQGEYAKFYIDLPVLII